MTPPGRAPGVTLLLPTKNRPEFVVRLLEYYADVGFDDRILIGDSSGPEGVAHVREAARRLAARIDVEHVPCPALGLAESWRELIHRVSTPYAAYLADDDFLVPRSLSQCARFLDTHPEYVAAHGAGVVVELDSNALTGNVVWCGYYDQTVSEADSGGERLRAHLSRYTVSLFSVHRADAWRAMFERVHLAPDMSFGAELLPSCLSVVLGKVKALDGLSVVRQSHDKRYHQPTMFDWVASPGWYPSYAATLEALADAVAHQDGLAPAEAKSLVHESFRYYVGRGMGLPSTYRNAGGMVAVARTLWHAWTALRPDPHRRFSLQALLSPSSPYHADFQPIYRTLVSKGT